MHPSRQAPNARSILIAGRKTGVSIEDAFWKGLKEVAADRNMTPSDLVTTINSKREHDNLSSAVRLFVLDHYRRQAVLLLRKRRTAKGRSRGGHRIQSER